MRASTVSLLFLLVTASAAPAPTARGEAAGPKQVVALYWYGKDFFANVEFDRGLQAALRRAPPGTLEYHAEYLESDRFRGPEQAIVLRDYLRGKYASHGADVVVAMSQVALDFLTEHRDVLFPDAPIVFHTFTRPPAANARSTHNMTGVVVDNLFAKTLRTALTLHPDTKQVLAIVHTSERNRAYEQMFRDQLRSLEPVVPLTYLSDLPLDALLARVKAASKQSIIFYVRYSQDEPGRRVDPIDVLSVIANAASVPVYAMAGSWLGAGSVGGYAVDLEDIGRRTGEIVLKIAAGARASDIPVTEVETQARFDWRQLRRWGIREAQLPPGSRVLFRAPTFWEQYGRYAIATLAVIAGQLFLIVGLLLQRRYRKRAEDRLRQSEMRYRNVVETQTELICRFLPDTTLTFVNDAYCRFFGQPREALIGRKFLEFVPPKERSVVLGEIESLVVRPRTQSHEHAVLLPDGTQGWQHWINHTIHTVDGKIVELQGVGRDVTQRRRAENALKDLAGRLIASQEAERQRIARDLHDDLSQRLALLNIDLDRLGSEGRRAKSDFASRVRDLSRRIGDICAELHRVSRDLHPSKLHALGLVAAIHAQCRDVSRRHAVAVEFICSRESIPVAPDLSLCLYRITQEALHNIVKHSHARRAQIRLEREPGAISLDIKDDGVGFDVAAGGEGLGLVSMRERANFAGGRFVVESEGTGTRIVVRVPLLGVPFTEPEDAGASEPLTAPLS
jgi:PAS domain S-box-containing protein